MWLKDRIKKMRDNYVINQVNKLTFPKFSDKEIRRYEIVFYGRVQKVGFRVEFIELAKRLELTGFCQNLKNGSVLTEVQGPNDKIDYLVSFMKSLKRIKIKKMDKKEIEIKKD